MTPLAILTDQRHGGGASPPRELAAYPLDPGPKGSALRCHVIPVILNHPPQDVPNLRLERAIVRGGAALQIVNDVVAQPSDVDVRHDVS